MTIKALLLIQILVFLQLACTKTETIEVEKISQVEVPRQVEVPVTVPGKTETITVTETMVIDQGIGVDSLPIEIEKASAREQEIGKAVVRILGLLGVSVFLFLKTDFF